MGGALDVTGPDLGPGDQAARLGLRSVGPFPLPILSLSLSFFLVCLNRGGMSVRENKCERERERSANHRQPARRLEGISRDLAMGKEDFRYFSDY